MYNTLIRGLREEDFMTLRWNADVHTVYKKTGGYRILDNNGSYLGEIIKDGEERYKIMFYGDMESVSKEVEKMKKVAEMIVRKQLPNPEYQSKKVITFSPHLSHYQRNPLRFAA